MATSTCLTIEDFEKLPDEAVKNRELVDGELVDVSGNNLGHIRLRDSLVRLLAQVVEDKKLGEIISEQEYDFGGNAHGPDVELRFKIETAPARLRAACSAVGADLAIEIESPNDTFLSLNKKAQR